MVEMFFEQLVPGTVRRFGSTIMTRAEILEFARRYDPQPFHVNEHAASEGLFKALAASGWHTCATAMRMIVDDWQAQGLQTLGSPGIDELRWLKPVFPGEVLTVEQEIIEVHASSSRPELGSVKQRTEVFNQDDVSVLRMFNWLFVRRQP